MNDNSKAHVNDVIKTMLERSNEVLSATPEKELMWCDYQKSEKSSKK